MTPSLQGCSKAPRRGFLLLALGEMAAKDWGCVGSEGFLLSSSAPPLGILKLGGSIFLASSLLNLGGSVFPCPSLLAAL